MQQGQPSPNQPAAPVALRAPVSRVAVRRPSPNPLYVDPLMRADECFMRLSGFLRRLAASIGKRVLWRRHLAEARGQLAALRAEAGSLEEMLAVPVQFRGRGYYASLELRQNQAELIALAGFLRGRELKRVCEIGTFRGGSLFIWCQLASRDAHVISVDLAGSLFSGGHRRRSLPFFHSFRQPRQRLDFVRGDSHAPAVRAQVAALLGDQRLDLLFIDGDHTYEGVKKDFEDYGPLVRPGGLIAFHDIVRNDAKPEIKVWQLWQEIKQQRESVEFVDPDSRAPRMGIGVVFAGGAGEFQHR